MSRSDQDSCAGSSWGMALELRLDGSAPWLNSSALANRSTRLRVSLGDNSPSSPHLRLARSSGHIGERDTAWKLWAPRCLLRQCSLKIHERNPELSNHSILIGWSRFRPRTILPSWRQAIGKGGFRALCSPPPRFHTASGSKQEDPGVTAPGLPLFTRKNQFQNSLGFEEENPKSMEDLRAFTPRPPTDRMNCRRCDQSTPVHSLLDTPIWGGHRNGHRNQGDCVTSRVYSPVRVKRSGIELMRM